MPTADAQHAPHLHTPLPTAPGERRFADLLLRVGDDKTHLWFGVNPSGGREIDVVLAHEERGIFIIEVKAKPLNHIHRFTTNMCELEGQRNTEHPVNQALTAMYKLKTLLMDMGYEGMWFTPTAAFPLVRRADFNAKFRSSHASFVNSHIDGLIFQDDLQDLDSFLALLDKIAAHPPAGGGAPRTPDTSTIERGIAQLIKVTLGADGPAVPNPQQFAVTVGRPRKESIRQFLEPGQRSPVVINGLPGSGKTQALIDIAVNHAAAGRCVLLVCFNKVLGTVLRQELDAVEMDASARDRIIVADLYDLRKALRHPGMSAQFRGRFGTVCVDEAQDLYMKDFGLMTDLMTFADPVVAEDAEWFFAIGRDQELYGTAPERVRAAMADPANVHELRRTIDNSEQGYRASAFSQAAFDVRFNPDKATAAAEGIHKRVGRHREHLRSDALRAVRVTTTTRENRVEQYKQVISKELERLAETDTPNDLMIMVPKVRSAVPGLVIQALTELEVPYLDQVNTDYRRVRLGTNQVRLVTVHSARGLQATRTIIFGAHDLEFAGGPETETNSAAYIALSRAMESSHVVIDEEAEPSRFQQFIVDTRKAYAQLLTDAYLSED